MASPSALAIQAVVRRVIQPMLKAEGFAKSGLTFRRNLGDCVQVVNVQSSAFNDGFQARFTINVGVYFPAAAQVDGGILIAPPGPKGPTDRHCHRWQRIGVLMPDGRDLWWSVKPGGADMSADDEVSRAVRDHALPWLARVSEPKAALRDLEAWSERLGVADSPTLIRVILAVAAGEIVEARALATRLLESRPENQVVRDWAIARGLVLS